MTRKKDKKYRVPVICGECMKPIDYAEVLLHRIDKTEYVHDCGRILVKGK